MLSSSPLPPLPLSAICADSLRAPTYPPSLYPLVLLDKTLLGKYDNQIGQSDINLGWYLFTWLAGPSNLWSHREPRRSRPPTLMSELSSPVHPMSIRPLIYRNDLFFVYSQHYNCLFTLRFLCLVTGFARLSIHCANSDPSIQATCIHSCPPLLWVVACLVVCCQWGGFLQLLFADGPRNSSLGRSFVLLTPYLFYIL